MSDEFSPAAALERYGKHDLTCGIYHMGGSDIGFDERGRVTHARHHFAKCSCGYEKALDAARAEEGITVTAPRSKLADLLPLMTGETGES